MQNPARQEVTTDGQPSEATTNIAWWRLGIGRLRDVGSSAAIAQRTVAHTCLDAMG